MESFQEGFTSFITGFSIILLIAVVIWMIGLVVLLFRELFSPTRLDLRDYLYKVLRMLIVSVECTIYGTVVIAPIMMYVTEEYLRYGMITVAAVILTVISLYIRRQTGGWGRSGMFRIRRHK